jgi:hypothetical protein
VKENIMKCIWLLLVTSFAASAATPTNQISWVASSGNDANACTRVSPCRTFQGGHDKTVAGGTVAAVDAADYGSLTISKAITIDGNGVGAEITTISGAGIAIGTTTGQVVIKDLTINASGAPGITTTVNTHLENVVVTGSPTYGVWTTFNGSLIAKNLTVAGATSAGILVQGASASIRDSVARGTTGAGILVQGDGTHGGLVLIERSELSFNQTGLSVDNTAGGTAMARISDSVITGNTTGMSTTAGGQIVTFRTNILIGNATDGSTPFSISLK